MSTPNPAPIQAAQHLLELLKLQEKKGTDRLWLSSEAKADLTRWKELLKAQPSQASTSAQPVIEAPAPTTSPKTPHPPTQSPPPPTTTTTPAPSPAQLPQLHHAKGLTREEKQTTLLQHYLTLAAPTLRETFVPPIGDLYAEFMLVGEAPGADEEQGQEPFIGKAGQLLTKILNTMGLQREQVYITNIVKFRPKMEGSQTSGNRKPTSQEMAPFLSGIEDEIAIVRPKVVLALGATAAEGLGLPAPIKIGALRGQRHQVHHTPLLVTYHPSYLLRNQAPSERRKVWEDMLQVMDLLDMPISDKQRGFFKS